MKRDTETSPGGAEPNKSREVSGTTSLTVSVITASSLCMFWVAVPSAGVAPEHSWGQISATRVGTCR